MPTSGQIQAFKDAFKTRASDKVWQPRWNVPTGCFAFMKQQTRLAPVVAAIDDFAANIDREHLDAVYAAIRDLPEGVRDSSTYATALDELKASLDACAMETDTQGDMDFVRFGDGSMKISGLDGEEIGTIHAIAGAGRQDTLIELVRRLGTIDDPPVVGLDKVVKSVIKSIELAAPTIGEDGIDGTIWDQGVRRITDTVIPRITDDIGYMRDQGLVPEGFELAGLELSGSDFHKGGHQVVFLNFEHLDGSTKKVVYKPSDLAVDNLLFGTEGIGSVLGDISTYDIAPMEDDTGHKYGYLEFVDGGDGATTAEDVQGILVGMAANMALSAYVGLEDVHHENVLMLTNTVQVIDMEATTGLFKMDGANANSGGFIDQLWAKALNDGTKRQLQQWIIAGTLTELPENDTAWEAMRARFALVLQRVAGEGNAQQLEALETALAGHTARLVPLETNVFQTLVIPKSAHYDSLELWQTMLDTDDVETNRFLTAARGLSGAPLEVVRNVLYTRGVYDALRRGDVPYYLSELGSSVVRDETGAPIVANGHPKVGGSIAEAMAARRDPDTHQEMEALFETQVRPIVNAILNSCRQFLPV